MELAGRKGSKGFEPRRCRGFEDIFREKGQKRVVAV